MSSDRQYLLRGTRTDEKAMQAGAPLPYALAEGEHNMTPDQLTNLAIKRVCNYSEKWSDGNWQWIKENFRYSDDVYHNIPLYDTGFWNLLYRVVSNEGYDYVWDGGGYNSNTINWNGAEAMPYMLTDFSQPTNFFRITTGFHTLPATLATTVRHMGVKIIGGTRLISFAPDGDRTLGVTQRGHDPATRARFRARAMVLAMPQRSLELIDQQCSFFTDQRVQYTTQSVLPQPSYKLFLAYEKRWWSKDEFYPGPTITDLPLRMTYDFGSEEERGGKPGDTRVLMLATYSDMQAASFWNVLERKEIYTQPPSWCRIASHGGAPAPDTMQRMAECQLVKSLSIPGAPPPKPTSTIGAYYQDWSQDPYGAGYHAWAAHYKAWEAMRVVSPDLCRPFSRDRNGMILGEGAAMLLIESLEHVRARGAKPIAEIAGFGMSSDAHHITLPPRLPTLREPGELVYSEGSRRPISPHKAPPRKGGRDHAIVEKDPSATSPFRRQLRVSRSWPPSASPREWRRAGRSGLPKTN